MSAAHPNPPADDLPDGEVRVGIRDLRHNLSEYLRRAKAGETIVVTDRGEPVVHLGPVPKKPLGPIAQGIRDGLVTVPSWWPGPPPPLPEPLKRTREQLGGKLLTEVLQEMRDSERY